MTSNFVVSRGDRYTRSVWMNAYTHACYLATVAVLENRKMLRGKLDLTPLEGTSRRQSPTDSYHLSLTTGEHHVELRDKADLQNVHKLPVISGNSYSMLNYTIS